MITAVATQCQDSILLDILVLRLPFYSIHCPPSRYPRGSLVLLGLLTVLQITTSAPSDCAIPNPTDDLIPLCGFSF